MPHSTQDKPAVRYQSRSWVKVSLLAVLAIETLSYLFLRLGIDIQFGVSLAVLLVAVGVFSRQILRLAEIASSTAKVTLNGRLQFSLRTLLLVVSLLAVVSAFVGGELRRANHELSVVSKLEKLGADVVYDVKVIREGYFLTRDDEAGAPSFFKRLVGIEGSDVNCVNLNLLFVRQGQKNSKIKDDCMVDIASLNNLKVLDMRGTGITDAGLVHLYALTELELILVSGTQITDDGIRRFKEFNQDCDVYRQPLADIPMY